MLFFTIAYYLFLFIYIILFSIARVGFGTVPSYYDFSKMPERRGRILAVVGAGHLDGIIKHLQNNGISEDRIIEISTCSKSNSTWPGRGVLHVVNMPSTLSGSASAAASVSSPSPSAVSSN